MVITTSKEGTERKHVDKLEKAHTPATAMKKINCPKKKYMLWEFLPRKAVVYIFFKLFLINNALNYFRFAKHTLKSYFISKFCNRNSLWCIDSHQHHNAHFQDFMCGQYGDHITDWTKWGTFEWGWNLISGYPENRYKEELSVLRKTRKRESSGNSGYLDWNRLPSFTRNLWDRNVSECKTSCILES